MGEQAIERAEGAPQAPRKQSGSGKGLLTACTGGLITGVVVGALLAHGPAGAATTRLALTAPDDLTGAATTLAPAASALLIAEARQCTAPLAHVMISSVNGGTIRIRSGAYLSPAFRLSATPQRVAIPFPAPYPAGRGTLAIVGNATGAVVSLTPAWYINALNGSTVRPVVWTPKNPC